MAPIFKKVAADYVDKVVFVKIDTNAQHELSGQYQIRSLPTFLFFVNGKQVQEEKGGIGEAALRHHTDGLLRKAEIENVVITLDALKAYYKDAEPNKSEDEVETVHRKCVSMNKNQDECVGSAANQLARRLRKKYGSMPKSVPRFTKKDQKSSTEQPTKEKKPEKSSKNEPNLHMATIEQLQQELEKRLDDARDEQVEAEDENEDEEDPFYKRWTPSGFPERVVIIGGGPAGMAAAIYASRAGLDPLVIAPSMGGQLQGKGVEVENYPGLHNSTGPSVVAAMRQQAAHFGALFEDDIVTKISASSRPLQVHTNATGVIDTHSVIVASGAEANWLGIPGEWELRGAGVSSCATCDGFLFSNQDVVVVGGGDAAAEDALVLARTSKSVTLIHRRDELRASKVLRDRLNQHPLINIVWDTVVEKIVGGAVEQNAESEAEGNVDLDTEVEAVKRVVLKNVKSNEKSELACDAVFIAIGHTPSTEFLKGVTDFDPEHPGYLFTRGGSTETSVPGIFAAGDVADSIYRQAITSAGSGAAAALDAERYLSENGLGNEAADLEAELLAELQMDTPASSSYNVYEDAGGRGQGIKETTLGSEL